MSGYKTIPNEIRNYASGLYGRLAAPLSADFLERANINPSHFVTEAPARRMEPAIPALRAELGTAATDEDLLLAAFYGSKLLELAA